MGLGKPRKVGERKQEKEERNNGGNYATLGQASQGLTVRDSPKRVPYLKTKGRQVHCLGTGLYLL
jgi:hypothetical protein